MRKRSLQMLGALLASLGFSVMGQVPAPPPGVSLPPMPPSPIEDFRHWLSQSPAQRNTSLAAKAPGQRAYLLSKLAEYQALSVAQREAKLQVLELRWYLRPLMEVPPAQRDLRIARIPEPYRELVRARLQEWDALPLELQKDVLENEETMHYFVRTTAEPARKEELLKQVDPIQRILLEQRIARWEALPPQRRERMSRQFNHFFQLPENERTKTLSVMSENERAEMERTLKAFEKLPSAQRKICIESFEKFANMTPEERREFLRDAARWQTMSEKERAAWRNLVTALPPLPDTSPLPPLPRSTSRSPLIVSNAPTIPFPAR